MQNTSSSFDFTSNSNYPLPRSKFQTQGTRAAGLIAAAPNPYCGVGVAWGVSIGGLSVNFKDLSDLEEASLFGWMSDSISIYSFDLGYHDTGGKLYGPNNSTQTNWLNSIVYGRGGLGNIYVFSAGNGGYDQNCNFVSLA